MPIFEYFAKTPEAAAVFDAAMTSISTWESKAVVAAYDFSGISTLLDVAGGHGLMLMSILKTHKKMRGILFDLPHMTASAPRYSRAEASPPLPDRQRRLLHVRSGRRRRLHHEAHHP